LYIVYTPFILVFDVIIRFELLETRTTQIACYKRNEIYQLKDAFKNKNIRFSHEHPIRFKISASNL
jgi:hypothetical protein